MIYMIAGGGTGGHIFPALAIGEALEAAEEGACIVYVGTRYGMEKDLLPARGKTLLTLPIRGFLGKSFLQKLDLLWRLPASMLKSLWLLLRYRPKAVIGVGGYASAPLLWTAALLRIPTLIQEQNAFPGLANRIGSRVARLACLGFPEASAGLHCPTLVTGNPVRTDLTVTEWSPDRDLILIMGGSQGAQSLNRDLPVMLKRAIGTDKQIRVLHQCGRAHVENTRAAWGDTPFPVEVTPFIEDMSAIYNQALLVICRAGASTIAELKLLRVPAVLIPFPRAAHDHQTFNARSLAATGAAMVITENDLPQSTDALRELLNQRRTLDNMAAAYPTTGVNAAQLCAEKIRAL